ncbi:PilZ domain protein [Caballeronia udeis]|uniref:PilZ domain protein n=1 Tax=Caballeronia udeis TaxID=1232866 RepID=A0A158GNY9_9BURK|nr:PilZ domain-containing protein [Caballeronia udeis]SAL33329.1 PilZ domain protein [Caballeronia udeis]
MKITRRDIALDRETDFPIYSLDGQLLLQKGQIVSSESLLERLYRLGHRQDDAPLNKSTSGLAAKPPDHKTNTQAQRLFGTAGVRDISTQTALPVAEKPAVLPDLQQKIEFFQLTPVGVAEAVPVELVGVIQDKAVIVRSLGEEAALTLVADTRYEARLFTGARLFKFSTQLLLDVAGPFGCFYLEYPASVAQAAVRKHQRVTTSFRGKLQSGEYNRPTVDVTVNNISSIGAGVSATEDFLLVGQSARLSMNLEFDHRVRPVMALVEVRNRREEADGISYGLEFVRIPEEVRREIKDFVLHIVATM